MPGKMVKLKEGDPSITIDGKPLEDHLGEMEKKVQELDLEVVRKQEIITKSKHKRKHRPRERFEDDPARVSKRVRHLSPFEIRKEYGVKKKPFPSLKQNVLYVLFNAGETMINSRAISDEVGSPLENVSSVLSEVWRKLSPDGLIGRKKVGMAYQYALTPKGLSMGFTPVILQYFPRPGGVRGKRAKEKPTLDDIVSAEQEPITSKPEGVDKTLLRLRGLKTRMDSLANDVFKRIEAIEQDGLERRVQGIDSRLQSMAGDFEHYKKGVSADIREIFDVENKPPGEFNINFNVRFLFGS